MQIFVDMDGVLADFDGHYKAVFGVHPDKVTNNVDWNAVRTAKDFYLNIPPMADLPTLWDVLISYEPIILTGIPSSVQEAEGNKRAWVRKHFGSAIEVRCCRSSEKYRHAKSGDLLIDDWEKYKHLWIKAGGVWITHHTAAETVQELTRLGACTSQMNPETRPPGIYCRKCRRFIAETHTIEWLGTMFFKEDDLEIAECPHCGSVEQVTICE